MCRISAGFLGEDLDDIPEELTRPTPTMDKNFASLICMDLANRVCMPLMPHIRTGDDSKINCEQLEDDEKLEEASVHPQISIPMNFFEVFPSFGKMMPQMAGLDFPEAGIDSSELSGWDISMSTLQNALDDVERGEGGQRQTLFLGDRPTLFLGEQKSTERINMEKYPSEGLFLRSASPELEELLEPEDMSWSNLDEDDWVVA